MEIVQLNPCGYCKGVYDAIQKVFSIKKEHPEENIYCIGQIVHNQYINEKIKKEGIQILEMDKKAALDSIQEGIVIFSAHGTSQELIDYAKQKGLIVVDTICPFVKKGMDLIQSYLNNGYAIIYIGKKNHPEAIATTSLSKNIHLVESIDDLKLLNLKNNKIFLTNQTTISIRDLKDFYLYAKEKYPSILFSDEICSSTRTRQEAILKLKSVDGLIVVGDKKSNNTNNLYKIAKDNEIDAILVESKNHFPLEWLKNKKQIRYS